MGFGPSAVRKESSEWDEVDDSLVNTAVTITHAAEAGRRHYVVGFEASTRGADLTADIQVELREGATVRWRINLGSGSIRGERGGVVLPRPREYAENAAVTLNAGGGGAGVIVTLNMLGYTI